MVDLDGPVGIDAAIMMNKQVEKFTYASPYVGQPDFDTFFEPLIEAGVSFFSFPFFPSIHTVNAGIYTNKTAYDNKKCSRVIFIGSRWGIREYYLDILARNFKNRICILNNISPDKYLRELESSTAAIDFRGGHAATYRFHEIILSSCAPIIEKRSMTILGNRPVANSAYQLFSNKEELCAIIEFLLAKPDSAIEIGKIFNTWYQENQNPSRLIDYIFSISSNDIFSKKYIHNLVDWKN